MSERAPGESAKPRAIVAGHGDFANGLVFQGFNIPALSTRRVQTEIELESGQTFAIGGLLDNRAAETLSKIPGIGDIPIPVPP